MTPLLAPMRIVATTSFDAGARRSFASLFESDPDSRGIVLDMDIHFVQNWRMFVPKILLGTETGGA